MDPARIFTESLTPRPELENSLGQKRKIAKDSLETPAGLIRTPLR